MRGQCNVDEPEVLCQLAGLIASPRHGPGTDLVAVEPVLLPVEPGWNPLCPVPNVFGGIGQEMPRPFVIREQSQEPGKEEKEGLRAVVGLCLRFLTVQTVPTHPSLKLVDKILKVLSS